MVGSDFGGRKASFQTHAHGRCGTGGTGHLLSRSIGLDQADRKGNTK